MRSILGFAVLLGASAVAPTLAHANVTLTSATAAGVSGGAAGLSGSYYHEGSGTTGFSLSNTLALMASSTVTGTFISTAINYTGGDSSTITSFLGGDASSYKGPAAAAYDLSDAILHLTGYFYAAVAETVSFAMTHDDAGQLKLGGQTVLASNIGTDTNTVTFSAPGYYSFDLVYSNTSYNGGIGGASLGLTANGATLTSANVVQTVVPEPASLAVLGTALFGLVAFRRRTRRV